MLDETEARRTRGSRVVCNKLRQAFLPVIAWISACGQPTSPEPTAIAPEASSPRASRGAYFEANNGQWPDEVAFRASTPSGTVWVTRDGQLVHHFTRGEHAWSLVESWPGSLWSARESGTAPSTQRTQTGLGASLRSPRGVSERDHLISYFIGDVPSRWVNGAHTYESVRLDEVWEGISIELRFSDTLEVEKHFVVEPGADPSRIRASLRCGTESLRLSVGASGELTASSGLGEATLSSPFAFQPDRGLTGSHPRSRYRVTPDGFVAFEVHDYDASQTLVIDPTISQVTIGGSSSEDGASIVLAPNGDIYVASLTGSPSFPGTTGGAQTTPGGLADFVLLRLNSDLELIQTTYVGGSSVDGPLGSPDDRLGILREESTGNIYFVGTTSSPNFPTTAGAVQSSLSGFSDGVIVGLNAALTSVVASTYLGGSWAGINEGLTAIAQASNGQIYVTGVSRSADYPGTAGAFQPAPAGQWDWVISQVNPALTVLTRTTFLGGTADEFGSGLGDISVDPTGDIVVAGRSESNNFPGTAGSAQPSFGGNSDVVIARLTPDLTSLLRSTYLGGAQNESSPQLAHTLSGDVLVLLETNSANFPTTPGTISETFGGGSGGFNGDGAVVRLSPDLTSIVASSFLNTGAAQTEVPWGLVVRPDGSLLVGLGHNGGGSRRGLLDAAPVACTPERGFLAAISDDLETILENFPFNFGIRGSLASASNGDIIFAAGNTDIAVRRVRGALTCCTSDAQCPDFGPCSNDGCLDNACQHTTASAGTACRNSAGPCDLTETCDGVSLVCPADTLQPLGTTCRNVAGPCDVIEACNGLTPSCPADGKRPNGFVCNARDQDCELDATCNGSSNSCPANPPRNSSFECRAAAGECDAPEFCNGSSLDCPNDVFDPSGTSCSGGVCTASNMCVECVGGGDCEDGNPCTTHQCTANACQTMNASAGTPCGAGLSCNSSGMCTGCTLPAQCADGNPCTDDVCTAGSCTNPAVLNGTACPGGVCDASGIPACVDCLDDSQCGADHCDLATNTCALCVTDVHCGDGNACTSDQCLGQVCSNTPVTLGSGCIQTPSGDPGFCSASGTCTECLGDTDCGGTTPLCDPSGTCVPCNSSGVTCSSGVCTTSGPLAGQCSECNEGSDCPDTRPLCDANTCLPCTSFPERCPAGTLCQEATGRCQVTEGCESDVDCASPTPTCDSNGECVGCTDVGCGALLCDPDRVDVVSIRMQTPTTTAS